MLMRRLLSRIALALLLGLFAAALVHLVQLRYAHGDVYPPYSSLRTDPLGTKVLYLALDALPGCKASRNLHPLRHLAPLPPATVYVLGAQDHDENAEELLKLAQSGARVIFMLRGIEATETSPSPTPTPSPSPSPQAKPSATPAKTLDDALGFLVKTQKAVRLATTEQLGLPPKIGWHSNAYFAELAAGWQTIYRCDQRPVLIERPCGRGSLVAATDSYLLSNEAMLNDRQPALLAWINGAGRQVIFDETHLNVQEQEGIATLIRKYRLLGLVGALAAFLALAAWHQAARFVPLWSERLGEQAQPLAGRDARAGFISLLHRSVPPRELLATCLAEWKQAHERPLDPARQQKLEAALIDPARRPLATYQALHQILGEKPR